MQFLRRNNGEKAPEAAPAKCRKIPAMLSKRSHNLSSSSKSLFQNFRFRSLKGDGDLSDMGTVRTQEMTTSSLSSAGFLRLSSRRRSTNVPFSSTKRLEQNIVSAKRPISCEMNKNETEEFGYLRFEHEDLQEALKDASDCLKPVFSLQALIPGDVHAGRDLFSHPLLVEAVETLFVTCSTVTHEPTARSPSGHLCCTRVQILDPDLGDELVPLISGDDLTRTGLITAMIKALEAMSLIVPTYLRLLLEEEQGLQALVRGHDTRPRHHSAVFAVQDVALGEAVFGGLQGVLATRVGRIHQQHIVEVTYDSLELSYSVLVRYALQQRVGDVIFYQCNEERMVASIESVRVRAAHSKVQKFDPKSIRGQTVYDPKHALRKTPMRFVPLTDLQATRANNLIQSGNFNQAVHLLSPRQGIILMKAMRVGGQKTLHEVVDVPLLVGWISVNTQQHPKHIQQNEPVQEPETENDDDSGEMDCIYWNAA